MPLNFLAEAGFWGLPRGCLACDPREIASRVSDFLVRERLGSARVRVWFSSSRIAFMLEGLPDVQSDQQIEIRGPRASIAYDFNKHLTPAATGFASGHGVEPSALFLRDVDGDKFLFARKSEKGKTTLDLLPELTLRLFSLIPWNIAPWATKRIFPQPPAYFCSMIDDHPPNFSIEELRASGETGIREGYSFKRIPLTHVDEFPRVMSELGVQPLPVDRKKFLETQFQSIVEPGSTIRRTPARLERICFERERPRAFSLPIPNDAFALPTAILNEVLDECPSFLPVESAKGGALPFVLGFTDSRFPGPEEVNLRADSLRERLEEAERLWAKDTLRPLAERVGELRQIPADDMQGTMYDSALHLSRLAHRLSQQLEPSVSEALLDRCLLFAALESSSAIRRRFPNLEGEIISLIAERQELELDLIAALRDLRLINPEAQDMPATPAGRIILLAMLYHQSRSGKKRLPFGAKSLALSGDTADRFLELLVKRSFPTDLIPLRALDMPEDKVERAFWKEAVIRRLVAEGIDRRKVEWLSVCETCPPLGMYKTAKRWPEGAPREVEFFNALQIRIKNLLQADQTMMSSVESNAPDTMESQIMDRLSHLEIISDGEIVQRLEILIGIRADLEACLMGLPPVLDAQDASQAARIKLLKRVFAQLIRPPFTSADSQ
ncbi:MAG: glycine--tRNA ligase subunit beta [Candidatus Riflebacteria bacterium]|nr:glycine--tRNA ligase subunit beta [Candidatus Riflebacteria bacterium]